MTAQTKFSTPHPQWFPLPNTVIQYITMSPTSVKGYQKLLETCKYFYSKNPVVFIEWLNNNQISEYGRWLTHSKDFIKIDFDVIPYKIWLTRLLRVNDRLPDKQIISKMLKKVFCCNLSHINIVQQEITYVEYKMLTAGGNVSHLDFTDVAVFYNKKVLVPLESILERLPNINQFSCFSEENSKLYYITSETSKNLAKLPSFNNFVHLLFDKVSDAFDPSDFCNFLEKNYGIFMINFLPSISEEFRNEFRNNVKKAARNPEKKIQFARTWADHDQWTVLRRS